MSETKIKVPPIEELDEYERALCESADPADHTALLMRIALKGIGIDPDSEDWFVSGVRMTSSDPNLVTEEQKLYYRPAVKKIHTLKGHVEDWPKYESINSYEIKGRGKVFTVHMDRWIKAHIESGTSVRGKYVEIDGEAYILKGIEYSKGLSFGQIVGLQVMKVPLAENLQSYDDPVLASRIENERKRVAAEQRRIDKSVQDEEGQERHGWMDVINSHPLRGDNILMSMKDYAETLRLAGVSEEEIRRRISVMQTEESEDEEHEGSDG